MTEPRLDPDGDGATPLYPHVWDQAAYALQCMDDWVGSQTTIDHAVDRFTRNTMTVRVTETDAEELAGHLRGRAGVASATARPTKSGWRVMVDFGPPPAAS